MKAFSFRLEPILHLREGARKSALTIYAKSIRESQKLENELFTLEQSLEDMKKVISAQRKRKFQAEEDHELVFCCAGTKSRLCAGCASQNSVLVVCFPAFFAPSALFLPRCAGSNPVGFAHWATAGIKQRLYI